MIKNKETYEFIKGSTVYYQLAENSSPKEASLLLRKYRY
jgi:hypothetical protein